MSELPNNTPKIKAKTFLLIHGKGYVKEEYGHAVMQVYSEERYNKENGWPEEFSAKLPEIEVGEAIGLYPGDDTYATVVRIG
jgi:hypothetical protein